MRGKVKPAQGCLGYDREWVRLGGMIWARTSNGWARLCLASLVWLAACQGSLNQALLEAVNEADGEEVRDLVEDGADPNFRDDKGSTVLMLAVVSGTEEGMRVLLEGGADPNLTVENGSTAVHMAAATGQTALLRILLEHGGDPNVEAEASTTPLMMASLWSRADTVTALAEAGADLDARNDEDRTALMIAVTEKRPEIVRALLDAGASPTAARRGITPLMMARQEGTTEIELMLRDAMGLTERSQRRRF